MWDNNGFSLQNHQKQMDIREGWFLLKKADSLISFSHSRNYFCHFPDVFYIEARIYFYFLWKRMCNTYGEIGGPTFGKRNQNAFAITFYFPSNFKNEISLKWIVHVK